VTFKGVEAIKSLSMAALMTSKEVISSGLAITDRNNGKAHCFPVSGLWLFHVLGSFSAQPEHKICYFIVIVPLKIKAFVPI